MPYRDFAVEYPPAALPVFIAPALVGDYPGTFAWLMATCGVALVCVLTLVRREAAFYAALAPVLIGSLILSRFDLWPTLLFIGALVALLAERHSLGWGLLGGAVAAKLWPLVVVPLALVWSIRHGRGRAALVGALVVAIAFVPLAIVAPHGMWHSLRGQASRPLQVESLVAAFLTTFGHPHVVSTHGSQNLAGHGLAAGVLSATGVVVIVALWIGFAAGDPTRERLLRYVAASVCAFVAFDKVLSPQYLLWLIPLVPLVRGRRGVAATVLLTIACVLTQVWFPFRYWAYVDRFHLAWVVLLRDVVLLALLAVLALPAPTGSRGAPSTR